MSIEGNKALVRRFIEELWGQGDLAVADALLSAEDAAVYKAWVGRVRTGLTDLRAMVEELVAEDDRVVVFWTWEGTHSGVLTGGYVDLLVPAGRIDPTGKRITMTGCFLFRVTGGKLARVRMEGDNFGLFQQLGVLPTAGARDR